MEQLDTVVIGAGQAGLAVGYHLAKQGCKFVILDADHCIGGSWRSRWDSLRLFTPARYSNLPGMRFPRPPNSNTFYLPSKDEVADYLESYSAHFALPILLDTKVESITRQGNRYMVVAGTRTLEAEHVVVATGAFQAANVPSFAQQLDKEIMQLHSSEYRNPDQLQKGDTLVVGAGQSGMEISMEVADSRRTWLSGPKVRQFPQSVFGLDIFWWYYTTRLIKRSSHARHLRRYSGGGSTVGVADADLTASGVERVPRTWGVKEGKPMLRDGRLMEVANVIWCTGFRPNFQWISLPVFAEDGNPVHFRGVSNEEPGLYFVGLHLQYRPNSALIGGVGADAKYIVEHIAHHRERRNARR